MNNKNSMLTGIQIGIIRNKIIEIYDDKDEFDDFLLTRLNKKFGHLTSATRYPFQVKEIVNNASTKGWIEELLIELRAENPKNLDLLKLVLDLQIGIGAYNAKENKPIINSDALQNIVNSIPQQNVAVILEGISQNKKSICRIEIPTPNGMIYGTGFLIGPDQLLTNYHVFEPIHQNPSIAPHVVCRFDYEAKSDGTILYAGTEVKLHADYIVAHSEYSPMDKSGTANLTEDWPVTNLDYAVIRLEKKIGDEPLTLKSGNATAEAPARGWIRPPQNPPLIFPQGHLHILQHPEGKPLQIAFGFQKIIGLSSNASRIRYEVNTLKGSSGSPCFNENFEWIGLHNMGDPSWSPTYNQGITAKTIIADLKLRFNINLN